MGKSELQGGLKFWFLMDSLDKGSDYPVMIWNSSCVGSPIQSMLVPVKSKIQQLDL